MKRTLSLLAVLLCAGVGNAQNRVPTPRPKMVLGIMVDQFRYDYLTRFRKDYNSGLAQLLDNGAVFTNAHLQHFPTVTAIGHSTFFSGATPAMSGIVYNEWFDRASGKKVTSVSDESTRLLGVNTEVAGASPRRLLVSTVGDEIKMSGKGASRTIGISLKDRGAILPAGRMADGAYWFDPSTGNFVSSTFYFSKLPDWVEQFNAKHGPDQYLGAAWSPLDASSKPSAAQPFRKLPTASGPDFYNSFESTPYGNELIETFAEQAIVAEQLGQHEGVDVLTVSFSSNDYVGHDLGPDAPEVRDMCLRTDRLLGKFLKFVGDKVGLDNVIVVLSADHGVAPLPENMAQRKMPGGRLSEPQLAKSIETKLTEKYGPGPWIVGNAGPAEYLNTKLIESKQLNRAEVEDVAAQAAREFPNMFRVYTRHQLQNGSTLEDEIDQLVRRGFHQERSADLFVIPLPYWVFKTGGGTTHGTPFSYDTHVPIVFMGKGIKPGRYHHKVAANDIAPTLAAMLDIETPSGSLGRILDEMFQ